jgi:RES domain-containing protein
VIELEIPDSQIEQVSPSALPENWRAQPSSRAAQVFGANWLRTGTNLALQVPSVVIPEEKSLLLNPFHPLMSELVPGTPLLFSFDSRLAG